MIKWLLACVPLVAGFIVSLVLALGGEGRRIVVEFQFAWVFLLVGAILTAMTLAIVIAVQVLQARAQRDVAEGRRQQRAAHAMFLRRLDHELKNPVMGIRAALANVPVPATGEADAAVRSIGAASERLTRLVTDLRKLSDIQTVALEITPVDLADLAAEAIDVARESLHAHNRTITATFPRAPRPLPAIPGDQDLLFLALTNVVTNAIKYSQDGDTIEIRGSEDGDGVTIDVADTGLGIDTEDLPHVWDELARGRATMHVPGTGLGLPFVRAIIERHGGQVSLRSRLGEGTSVRLRLPTTSAAARGDLD